MANVVIECIHTNNKEPKYDCFYLGVNNTIHINEQQLLCNSNSKFDIGGIPVSYN